MLATKQKNTELQVQQNNESSSFCEDMAIPLLRKPIPHPVSYTKTSKWDYAYEYTLQQKSWYVYTLKETVWPKIMSLARLNHSYKSRVVMQEYIYNLTWYKNCKYKRKICYFIRTCKGHHSVAHKMAAIKFNWYNKNCVLFTNRRHIQVFDWYQHQ